jgi:hypothetical protein
MGVLVSFHRDARGANPPVSSTAYIRALVRDATTAVELCRTTAEQIALNAEAEGVERFADAFTSDQLLELLANAWEKLARLAEVTEVPGPSLYFPCREIAEAVLAKQGMAPDIIYSLRQDEAGRFSVGVYRLAAHL